MSAYKKKTKHHKQKALKPDGEAKAEVPGGEPEKDIDVHPLQCGHSVVVMYRDSSHRLAKVSFIWMHLFSLLKCHAAFCVLVDLRTKFQQDSRLLDVLYPLL